MSAPPNDSATTHTFAFVQESLARAGCRLLEIGAGDGRLAAALVATGHTVVAIDSDVGAVAKARARGVDARQAQWPDFADGTFDAILFTRSLHHQDDLGAAIGHALQQLRRAGVVIVEDFHFLGADRATVVWLTARAARLVADGSLRAAPDSFLAKLLRAEDPFAAWQEDHHHVHSGPAMRQALLATGRPFEERRTEYLFRYLDNAPSAVQEAARAAEAAQIEAGTILPIGLRFVLRSGDR